MIIDAVRDFFWINNKEKEVADGSFVDYQRGRHDQEGEKILVFTGAGLSTESGIPDLRSTGGIWDKHDPSS